MGATVTDVHQGTSGFSVRAVQVGYLEVLQQGSGLSVLTEVVENAKLNDCYYEKKDWRACKEEVCTRLRIQRGLHTLEARSLI